MNYLSLSHRRKSAILIITALVHLLLLLIIFAGLLSDEQSGFNPRHLLEPAHILPQSPLTSPQATVIFQDDPHGTPGEPEVEQDTQPDQAKMATPSPVAEQKSSPDTQETKEPEKTSLDTPVLEDVQTVPHDTQQKPQTYLEQKKMGQAGGAHGLTLGDITQGFLKSVHQEHGRVSKIAADAQTIARQRYSTRVWSMIKQAYRAHRSPTYLLSDLSTQAILNIQINKEGQLLHIELEHQNKTHDLYEVEQIIIKAAKKAGLFPPIPAAFNADTITLTYPIMISVKEGMHVYDFVYQ